MKRSKRIEALDKRAVNLDGFIDEWPEMGFVAMKSPYDPEPSLKVENGVITELDKEGMKEQAAAIGGKEHKQELLEQPMWDLIVDKNSAYGGGGSTDVGDVSWVVPTAQVYTSCYAAGTALHSWQAVAQGKSSIAHKGMLAAAKVMAYVGAELLLNPELIERAKADWKEELDGETYPNPLPADLKPSIW